MRTSASWDRCSLRNDTLTPMPLRQFKNPTGEINAIRERVRQVCSNDEALRDLGVLEDDAGFKIPGIIHTYRLPCPLTRQNKKNSVLTLYM